MSNDVDLSDNGDLRDPALRRALDHAPDRDATPDPRTRDAILKMAHNLAAAPAAAPASAANNASAAPWWRRLFGNGDTRARMPWNAAFATVLVAGFVTVLWHREPIPDARLDGEAKVASAPAPAAAPTPPAAESAPQAPSPAIAAQQAPAAEAPAASPRDASKEAPDRATVDAARKPAPTPARKQAAPAPETKEVPPEQLPAAPAAPAVAQAPAAPAIIAAAPPPPAPAAPAAEAAGIAESAARVRQKSESVLDGREQERRSAYAAAPAPSVAPPAPIAVPERSPPAIAAAPPAPGAAPPWHGEPAGSALGAVARGGSPNADVSGALRDTAPPRAAATKATRSPTGASTFSALDRWTSFDFMRAGLGVQHARGDIEGLAALVNTVARSATAADMQLAAPVEARLSLHQGGTVIAVLEIAGDQVRWTPQPGGTATVGTPPAQALAALRALLTR
ncbi:hypothetical protein NU688_26875 [Variovorax sp. ZS18.2.2]|uniref:hypothetical protein n=1 Tax=Variovorax sp. ZS18.2.2 TaxID=2971255 RepID=UPI0021507D62|nr:hypothetical protein [Variovorax sp. ZS18.2.2]MCR6479809.1 hypothetical protein [Variovorax sp. ZS18.2.2]